jgi:hypothetical protein
MATKTNRLWAIAALVTMGTSFSACLKSVDTTPSRPIAAFTIINGILSSTALDFFDNVTTKPTATNLALGFGENRYLVYGGVHQFSFTKTGTLTPIIATTTNQFDSLNYYTLVTYGDSSSAVVRPIKDDFSSAVTTKLNIRFFNLSPNSPAVDLYLGDVKVDSNLAYIGNSAISTAFKAISNLGSASTLKVKLTGSSAAALPIAQNTTADLISGNVYTIYLTGMKDSSGPLKPQLKYVKSYY